MNKVHGLEIKLINYVINFICVYVLVYRNWSEVLTNAADIVMESLKEVEDEKRMRAIKILKSPSELPKISAPMR